jgi:hypothetical protein
MLCYRFYRRECSLPREGANAFWMVMKMIRLVEQLKLEKTQLKLKKVSTVGSLINT